MSITYCHNCNKNIDTDFDATHIEDCLEESKEETHSLKPLRQDREILLSKKKIKIAINNAFRYKFDCYHYDYSKSMEENVQLNVKRVREGVKELHKSINNMYKEKSDE